MIALPVPRPELAGLPVYEPGKAAPRGCVKLASNENSYGPSPKVKRLMRSFRSWERYPDGGAVSLRESLSRHLRVPPARILIGAGSDEIGDFLAHAYLRLGDAIVYPEYTFIRYAMCAQAAGARRIATRVRADFSVDVDALIRAVRASRPRMVCLANPNNPTGVFLNRKELEKLLEFIPARTMLVLDEAYFEYAKDSSGYPDGIHYLKKHPNLVVLRTFSKIHGLAAFRVGYAIAHPSIVGELHKVRPPFNTSSLGQAAAVSALSDRAHVASCAKRNGAERARVQKEILAMGYRVYPSCANFLLIGLRLGDPDGPEFFRALARRGVIVRDLRPYGLLRHLRVTIGTPAENRRLISAMRHLS